MSAASKAQRTQPQPMLRHAFATPPAVCWGGKAGMTDCLPADQGRRLRCSAWATSSTSAGPR